MIENRTKGFFLLLIKRRYSFGTPSILQSANNHRMFHFLESGRQYR